MKNFNKWRMERYYSRRAEFISFLGGKCVKCGTTENLEFDHIDPSKKSFEVGPKFWEKSLLDLYREIEKCQLLCRRCHTVKTIIDNNQSVVKGSNGEVLIHGTLSSYKYCKCDACKEAHATYGKTHVRKRDRYRL